MRICCVKFQLSYCIRGIFLTANTIGLLTKIEDEYNKFIRKNTDISMVLKRNNNNKIIISLNELDIEINYPKNYPDNDIT